MGGSDLVGKPLTHLLKQRDCDVTNLKTPEEGIPDNTRNADILIVAIGNP